MTMNIDLITFVVLFGPKNIIIFLYFFSFKYNKHYLLANCSMYLISIMAVVISIIILSEEMENNYPCSYPIECQRTRYSGLRITSYSFLCQQCTHSQWFKQLHFHSWSQPMNWSIFVHYRHWLNWWLSLIWYLVHLVFRLNFEQATSSHRAF